MFFISRSVFMALYEDLRELQQHSFDRQSLVLSVYVNVDQSDAANLNRGFETAAEDSIRQAVEAGADGQRFEEERKRFMHFLRGYTPRGKLVVVFSDSKLGFWWQRDLQVQLPTSARWSPQPWVRPLLELLEENHSLGLVLLDKHRARILTLDASGLEQHAEITSDVPNKHQTTGTDHIWSQSQMERDHVKHIKWHLRRVAEELGALVDRLKITRLITGGPVEATSLFVDELPKRLQQIVVDTIAVPVDVNADKLISELRRIQGEVEHEEEVKIVESLITSARKGGGAVLGISETLNAVQERRVYMLVVDKNYRAEGSQCRSCGMLLADRLDRCSFCGGDLEPVRDLINRASRKVLDDRGKVQMVSGRAGEKLSGNERIGAVLRSST
jgi:peptide chain release factor subunit 1